MTLLRLQILILALFCLVGWVVTQVPIVLRPGVASHCLKPADDMARRACADLGR